MADDEDSKKRLPQISQQVTSTGIINLPPGSRGPRSLYLKRHGGSFGFTLRHFIIYPPDGVAESDGRHAAVGALLTPMDTIFVRSVKENSPARIAGLQHGDRIVAVNWISVSDKTYNYVVHLIQHSPDNLHLLVVPKEEDVLQQFFAETAYNPVSNNPDVNELYPELCTSYPPERVTIDARSWNTLQQERNSRRTGVVAQSNDDIYSQSIYSRIIPNEIKQPRSRAQPQVPLYRKVSRRASEGNVLSDSESSYNNAQEFTSLNSYPSVKHKHINYLSDATSQTSGDMQSFTCSNEASSRLNVDTERDSTSSITSSIANVDNNSLTSYESLSHLTGNETDDSIMSRFRRNFQQKEEFFSSPNSLQESVAIARELYSKPKKMDKTLWPPNPTKNDRDLVQQTHCDRSSAPLAGGEANKVTQQNVAKSFSDRTVNLGSFEIHEAPPAPAEMSNHMQIGSATIHKDHRGHPLQMVHTKAKQFESGSPMSDDDSPTPDRTSYYKSELSRIKCVKLVPNATERAQEYESRVVDLQKDNSGTSVKSIASRKKPSNNTQTLESSGSASSCNNSISEEYENKTLSGNVLISSGSKFIHCPPPKPSDKNGSDMLSIDDGEQISMQSNSPELWITSLHADRDFNRFLPARRFYREDIFNPSSNDAKMLKVVLSDERPILVKRRNKNAAKNLTEEERAVRRESYLKATEGGRVCFETDSAPEPPKRNHNRNSASSFNAEKRGDLNNKLLKEGWLRFKLTEMDGKRIIDRPWKLIWARLEGPKLYFLIRSQFTDRISDAVESSLSAGVDVRESEVKLIEDFPKRGHLIVVSTVIPCRSEFLLQTDNNEELANWIKVLREQIPTSTDMEAETDLNIAKQQAVPQTTPASSTVLHEDRLSPPAKQKAEALQSTGNQSPVRRTRKSSQIPEPLTSPKSKTWRGKVANKFKRLHQGAGSPNSPTTPEGSTFGVCLNQCIPSKTHEFVPKFVEVCTDIIENRGLHTVGIYRVPGNNASITHLTEEINKNYDDVPMDDPKWNDLHVVSSLLKSYLRKLPDSLVTNAMYPNFLEADKIEDPKIKMIALKKLIKKLPPHHYHTLRHVILHLRKIVDNCHINKMETKNLAIVFGPTIVRAEEENMQSMVNNMTHQCKIVETFLVYANWFFGDSDSEVEVPIPTVATEMINDGDSAHNQALLLESCNKYEASKGQKDGKNGALFSSIITAAQRKVKRKTTKTSNFKEESVTSNEMKDYNMYPMPGSGYSQTDSKNIPVTVEDLEASRSATDKPLCFNYQTDAEAFHRRISSFEQETKAMLTMPRKSEISVTNLGSQANLTSNTLYQKSGKLSNENNKFEDVTDSKTNYLPSVLQFERFDGNDDSQHRLESSSYVNRHKDQNNEIYQRSSYINNYASGNSSLYNNNNSENNNTNLSDTGVKNGSNNGSIKGAIKQENDLDTNKSTFVDLSNNAFMKKMKYENKQNRKTSVESISKMENTTDDDTDLVAAMTKLYDKKLKEKQDSIMRGEDIPYADESPDRNISEKTISDVTTLQDSNTSFRNPSLHKNNLFKLEKLEDTFEESNNNKEKDTVENINSEKHKSTHKLTLFLKNSNNSNNKCTSNNSTGLKRSESLNKTGTTAPPISIKLKRSESLNTNTPKNEKSESNLSKKREFPISENRKNKEFTKMRRKTGGPDKSIKRRHTVGGTKDPDKITWLDNKDKNKIIAYRKNKEKSLRTSSPDLSCTRREKLLFEINLIGPEDMVVALREHLIGTRSQRFSESAGFKVPLESHV